MGSGLCLPGAAVSCDTPERWAVKVADWFVVECHCCTFYRGVGVGLLLATCGWGIVYLI